MCTYCRTKCRSEGFNPSKTLELAGVRFLCCGPGDGGEPALQGGSFGGTVVDFAELGEPEEASAKWVRTQANAYYRVNRGPWGVSSLPKPYYWLAPPAIMAPPAEPYTSQY